MRIGLSDQILYPFYQATSNARYSNFCDITGYLKNIFLFAPIDQFPNQNTKQI